MENPYATKSLSGTSASKSWRPTKALIVLISIAVIVANYATATTVPRELWDVFIHVVFLITPVSLLVHIPRLTAWSGEAAPSSTRWWLVALLLIPASFWLSISPYFSTNPYEGFVVMNRFFGPYGWVLWTWLIALGLLPFLELIPVLRRSRVTMTLLSLTAIGCHIHNAYWIWWICHVQ